MCRCSFGRNTFFARKIATAHVQPLHIFSKKTFYPSFKAAVHLSKLMARSSISASSSIYFDCMEGSVDDSQSLIKWSSTISLIGDNELPTPRVEQNMKLAADTTSDASLLVIIFYSDIFSDVSFLKTSNFKT